MSRMSHYLSTTKGKVVAGACGLLVLIGFGAVGSNFLQSSLLGGSDDTPIYEQLQQYSYAKRYEFDPSLSGSWAELPSNQGWKVVSSNVNTSIVTDGHEVQTRNDITSVWSMKAPALASTEEDVVMIDVDLKVVSNTCSHAESIYLSLTSTNNLKGGVTFCGDKLITTSSTNTFVGINNIFPSDLSANTMTLSAEDQNATLRLVLDGGTLYVINKDTGAFIGSKTNVLYDAPGVATSSGAGVTIGMTSTSSSSSITYAAKAIIGNVDVFVIPRNNKTEGLTVRYDYGATQKELEKQGWIQESNNAPDYTRTEGFLLPQNSTYAYALPLDIKRDSNQVQLSLDIDTSTLYSYDANNNFSERHPYVGIPTDNQGANMRIYLAKNNLFLYSPFETVQEDCPYCDYAMLRKVELPFDLASLEVTMVDHSIQLTAYNSAKDQEVTKTFYSEAYSVAGSDGHTNFKQYQNNAAIVFASNKQRYFSSSAYASLKSLEVSISPYTKNRNQDEISFSRTYRFEANTNQSDLLQEQGWLDSIEDKVTDATTLMTPNGDSITLNVNKRASINYYTETGAKDDSILTLSVNSKALSNSCLYTKNAYLYLSTETKASYITLCENQAIVSSTDAGINQFGFATPISELALTDHVVTLNNLATETTLEIIANPEANTISVNGTLIENAFYTSNAMPSRFAFGTGNGSDVHSASWTLSSLLLRVDDKVEGQTNSYSMTPNDRSSEGWNYLNLSYDESDNITSQGRIETGDQTWAYLPIDLKHLDDVLVDVDVNIEYTNSNPGSYSPTMMIVNDRYYMEVAFSKPSMEISDPRANSRGTGTNPYNLIYRRMSNQGIAMSNLYHTSYYNGLSNRKKVQFFTNDGDISVFNTDTRELMGFVEGGYRIPTTTQVYYNNELNTLKPGVYLRSYGGNDGFNSLNISVNKRMTPPAGKIELPYNAEAITVDFGKDINAENPDASRLQVSVAGLPAMAATAEPSICLSEGTSEQCTALIYNAASQEYSAIVPQAIDTDFVKTFKLKVSGISTGVEGSVRSTYLAEVAHSITDSSTNTLLTTSTRTDNLGVKLATLRTWNEFAGLEKVCVTSGESTICKTTTDIKTDIANNIEYAYVMFNELQTGKTYTPTFDINQAGVVTNHVGDSFITPQTITYDITSERFPVTFEPQIFVNEDNEQHLTASQSEDVQVFSSTLEDDGTYSFTFVAQPVEGSEGLPSGIGLTLVATAVDDPTYQEQFSFEQLTDTAHTFKAQTTISDQESRTYLFTIVQSNGYTTPIAQTEFAVLAPLPVVDENAPATEDFTLNVTAVAATSISIEGQFQGFDAESVALVLTQNTSSTASTLSLVPSADGQTSFITGKVENLTPDTSYGVSLRFTTASSERTVTWSDDAGQPRTITTAKETQGTTTGETTTVVIPAITNNAAPEFGLILPSDGFVYTPEATTDTHTVSVQWEATDLNQDTLSYKLYVMPQTSDATQSMLMQPSNMVSIANDATSTALTLNVPGNYLWMLTVSDGRSVVSSGMRSISLQASATQEVVDDTTEVIDDTTETTTDTSTGTTTTEDTTSVIEDTTNTSTGTTTEEQTTDNTTTEETTQTEEVTEPIKNIAEITYNSDETTATFAVNIANMTGTLLEETEEGETSTYIVIDLETEEILDEDLTLYFCSSATSSQAETCHMFTPVNNAEYQVKLPYEGPMESFDWFVKVEEQTIDIAGSLDLNNDNLINITKNNATDVSLETRVLEGIPAESFYLTSSDVSSNGANFSGGLTGFFYETAHLVATVNGVSKTIELSPVTGDDSYTQTFTAALSDLQAETTYDIAVKLTNETGTTRLLTWLNNAGNKKYLTTLADSTVSNTTSTGQTMQETASGTTTNEDTSTATGQTTSEDGTSTGTTTSGGASNSVAIVTNNTDGTVSFAVTPEAVTFGTSTDGRIAATITVKEILPEGTPVKLCYALATDSTTATCVEATKMNDTTYEAVTSIDSSKAAQYNWLLAVHDKPLQTSGTVSLANDNGTITLTTSVDKNDVSTVRLAASVLENTTTAETTTETEDTTTASAAGTAISCPPYCQQSTTAITDVATNNFAYTPIVELAKRGIMTGFPDETFRPGIAVNRAEFAKLIKQTFLIPTIDVTAGSTFFDVSDSAWYFSYARALSQVGLMTGYNDNTFKPSSSILRSEAAKLISLSHAMLNEMQLDDTLTHKEALVKAEAKIMAEYQQFRTANPSYTYALLPDVAVDQWYARYVYYAVRNELIKGREVNGTRLYFAGDEILRGEAATLLYRVIEQENLTYPVSGNESEGYTPVFPE